jgi:hypothetical protein
MAAVEGWVDSTGVVALAEGVASAADGRSAEGSGAHEVMAAECIAEAATDHADMARTGEGGTAEERIAAWEDTRPAATARTGATDRAQDQDLAADRASRARIGRLESTARLRMGDGIRLEAAGAQAMPAEH